MRFDLQDIAGVNEASKERLIEVQNEAWARLDVLLEIQKIEGKLSKSQLEEYRWLNKVSDKIGYVQLEKKYREPYTFNDDIKEFTWGK